jgi:hypothetical protein
MATLQRIFAYWVLKRRKQQGQPLVRCSAACPSCHFYLPPPVHVDAAVYTKAARAQQDQQGQQPPRASPPTTGGAPLSWYVLPQCLGVSTRRLMPLQSASARCASKSAVVRPRSESCCASNAASLRSRPSRTGRPCSWRRRSCAGLRAGGMRMLRPAVAGR